MQHCNHLFTRVCLTLFALFPLTGLTMAAEPAQRDLPINQPKANLQRPGSVLVYNIFTSSATKPANHNTSITVTNTHKRENVAIHLFVVRGNDGSVADAFICLTPNQIATFTASEIDPGSTGYLVMIASDLRTGCPIGFNYLAGSEFVKFPSGHKAGLLAESIPALFTGALPGCAATATAAKLNFDGVDYAELPNIVAADKILSLADGNSTMLILNSLTGSLGIAGGSVTNIGGFTGRVFDDAENGYGFSGNSGSQLLTELSSDFPLTIPRLATAIPKGRSGWMRITSAEGRGLTGAALNFNPNTQTNNSAYTGGHNLLHMKTTSGSLNVAVFPPSC